MLTPIIERFLRRQDLCDCAELLHLRDHDRVVEFDVQRDTCCFPAFRWPGRTCTNHDFDRMQQLNALRFDAHNRVLGQMTSRKHHRGLTSGGDG